METAEQALQLGYERSRDKVRLSYTKFVQYSRVHSETRYLGGQIATPLKVTLPFASFIRLSVRNR